LRKDVDWSEAPLQRWLGSITRSSTKATYKSAFRLYRTFTGLTASQLIDEAIEDQKRDPRQKTDIVKQRLIAFYNWLVKEAPRKKPGRNGGRVVGKGLSEKIAHTYVNAIRSFYGTFDVYVKLRGRSALPRPRVRNKRIRLNNLDVKRLVDHAPTLRDRAIILVLFQSGMDVSTLCSLTYGQVADGLAKGEHPLKLELHRGKSGVDYYTFLGKDAIDALKAYLNDLRAKGIQLQPNDPLFIKLSQKTRKVEGITPNLVQNMLKAVAIKAGFIDKQLNGRAFNPCGPHALRESFSTIMINKGVPDTVVDFWLGHSIGEMANAYKGPQFEEVKRLYVEREPFISISTSVSPERLEKEIKQKVDERVRILQDVITNLTAENLALKKALRRLEERLKELGETLTITEDDIIAAANLERHGPAGGISGPDILSINELSEEDRVKYALKVLAMRLIQR